VAAPSGLLSWWAGDGNASDRVGSNPGTLNNGVTFSPGEVSSAFQFNNTNYVSANTTGLPTGSSDRTLEMWVKVNTFGSGESYFAGYGAFGTSNQTYHLGTGSDHRLFFSQWGRAMTGPALQTGQWYHIAITTLGGLSTLYLNGSPVDTEALPIATPQNSQLYIGRIPGALGDSRQLDGLVDEVSVYNRALSSGEIFGIYKAGSDGKVLSPIAVDFPSVVEGSSGTTTPVTFTVTRTGSLSGSLTVNWTTADDTATAANSDYVAASGQITFATGEATKTIPVTVNGDNAVEPSETFKLILTPVGGTAIMGLATILTDDVSISIDSVAATEGSSALKFLDRFVQERSGGLSANITALTFGPDGNGDGVQDLYVATADTNEVLRYDGVTGAFLDTFVTTSGNGGLDFPGGLQFDPDGNLYVSSYLGNQVLRYNASGAFQNVLSSGLSNPIGITFGSDGSLFIANRGTNEVLRYKNGVLSRMALPPTSTVVIL
jgi:hypothetical protein